MRPSSTGRAAPELREAEAAHFRAFDKAQNLDPKEASELLAFARRTRVPLDKLEKVGAQAAYATPDEKMMAMRSYAVAADAVQNGKLSPSDRQLFREHVLPHLERGAIKMEKVDRGKLGGAEATYDSERNTYSDSGIDLGSVYDRATTIHELKHAAQDSLRETSSRRDSEDAAYDTGAEYILRETGVLSDAAGGGTRIDGSKLDRAVAADPGERLRYEKLIAGYGLANAEAGRNHLNCVPYVRSDDPRAKTEGTRLVSEMSAEDAAHFFRAQRELGTAGAKAIWNSASFVANVGHAKMLDADVLHARDGIP